MANNRKVVLVGTGFVGMSMAYSLENQGGINELVLIDVLKEKAEGEAMDLAHGLSCAPSRIDIKSGDYDECNGFDFSYLGKEPCVICIKVFKYKDIGFEIQFIRKSGDIDDYYKYFNIIKELISAVKCYY